MKNGNELKFLIDTGSNKNYINGKFIRNPLKNQKPFHVKSVGGIVSIETHSFIDIFNCGIGKLEFYILPGLETFDGIIGNDTLKSLNAVIYTWRSYLTILDGKKFPLKELQIDEINNMNLRLNHLNPEDEKEVRNILDDHPNLFADPNKKLTYSTIVQAEINTSSDSPVYSKSYPYPMALKSEIDKQIEELLRDGIIRPSRSAYNAPVWIVPKKPDASGVKKYRMVIDYRKLNEITRPDRYPIPEITEILANLGEQKYFSTIDLKSGFHQIPLRESDIEKTAFSVKNGKFEFTRLPFGLRNASAIFQRALDDILREHIGKRCYVYIDDILIFGRTKKEHIENLRIIFRTLEDSNLKVHLDKSEFLKEEIDFLGFNVKEGGFSANPDRLKAIVNFPQPRTVHDLRSFLGLTGHYRRFIRGYAQIAKPLTSMMRGDIGKTPRNQSKKISVNLNSEQIESFKQLKNCLVSEEVVLNYPDFDKPFELTTDASKYALGAVLSQGNRPITYLSRTLSRAEEEYATNEKEMLAIIWALKELNCYLYGARSIKIFTDHQPLTFALSNKNTNVKMKKWKAQLEEYNYELIYKPGSTNVVADTLSRPPVTDVNSLTPTVHSAEDSSEDLIPSAEVPINTFKNQIIIEESSASSYEFNIVFPSYHRHIIKETSLAESDLKVILKRYLNPTVVNGIKTSEPVMLMIQALYPHHFRNIKVRFARTMVEDVTDEERQKQIIIETHNRAHRNNAENRRQILESYYFPSMTRKIKNVINVCKVCKENKYERHPNAPKLNKTPMPTYPGHTIHIDIFSTDKFRVLTAIDKFTKFAVTRMINGKGIEDIRKPLREIIFYFGVPKSIVFDNERSFNSQTIRFMLEDELGMEIFTAPPYKSEVNGQIERFHSTLSEIMRCSKCERPDYSFEELLQDSVNKYNHTIHSSIGKKPVDLFFGRPTTFGPEDYERTRLNNYERLLRKQENDLANHNRVREEPKEYQEGQKIFVKQNKRLGTKLSKRFKEEVVKENRHSTVLTQSGKIVHKSHIRN